MDRTWTNLNKTDLILLIIITILCPIVGLVLYLVWWRPNHKNMTNEPETFNRIIIDDEREQN